MKKIILYALTALLIASTVGAQWVVSEGTKQSAAWTSATSLDTRLSLPVVSYSTVLVTLKATSTMTGGTLNFEASNDNGSTYPFPVSCVRVDSAAYESTFALSVTNKAWQCAIAGFTNLGVRLNPAVTGTGTATVTVIASQAPMQAPIAAIAGGSLAGNQTENLTQINGSTVVTGGTAGSQGVGGLAASNGAIVGNPNLIGAEAETGAQPAAATNGNVRQAIVSKDGAAYVRQGGPVLWSCGLDAIAATLTQCQAAPGSSLSLYITDITVGSTTATAGQFLVRYGTGSNCGTGTTSIFPSGATVVRYAYPPNTTAPTPIQFITPIQVPANNAVCIICVATNTCTPQINGFTAP